MGCIRGVTTGALLVLAVTAAFPQELDFSTFGFRAVREAFAWPDTIVLRLTGLFRSPDGEKMALTSVAPFEDESVLGQWFLVAGERYEYEVSVASEGEWTLRNLCFEVMGQMSATARPAAAVPELALTGSFVASIGAVPFPHFRSEGEAERDCTLALAVFPLPMSVGATDVQTDDPRTKVVWLDVRDFVAACERLGGAAVLEFMAPDGSTTELRSQNAAQARTIPVGAQLSSRDLPPPWLIVTTLPEGIVAAGLPRGAFSLALKAEGTMVPAAATGGLEDEG